MPWRTVERREAAGEPGGDRLGPPEPKSRIGRRPPPSPPGERPKAPARLWRAVALAYTYPIATAAAEADIRRVRAELTSPAGKGSGT
jgi:hypothetical protein